MNPPCSIVIRCRNEESHIGRLLHGITQQTLEDPEIIIVDSGSTDATLGIASRYPVHILNADPEEFSFGRALNTGIEAASSDVIVVASAHVYPLFEDWLETLVEPFEDEKVALTYGRQRGNEQTRFAEQQIFAHWFPVDSNRNQTHPFCNNANAAIRRAIWEQNRYDESLTGLEDLAWAKAALDLGYRICYLADAEIVHVHDETPSQIFNRYFREGIAMKSTVADSDFNLLDLMRLLGANIGSDFVEASRQGVLTENAVSIPVFRFLQFWGTYRGYRQVGPISDRLRKRFYYPSRHPRSRVSGAARDRSEIDYRGFDPDQRSST